MSLIEDAANKEATETRVPFGKVEVAPSSGISYHLRDIYSICQCCWNVATYKWKLHNGNIEIISFVVNFRS
jgi:hypothetical protein